MTNDYKVGSELWYKVSSLNQAQRIQLMDVMEEDILKYKKTYNDEYFYWLITITQEQEAKSFSEHRDLCYQIERLTWLRQKNVQAAYSEQEDRLRKQLEQVIPQRFLQDLVAFVDLASEKKAALEIIKTL